MRPPISPSDLQTLLLEADLTARRLQRTLRLPRADLDDLRQDLLADLIARLSGFDPGRGTLGAFAGMVTANRATRIAAQVSRHRRMYGALPTSLDDPIPGSEGLTRGDLLGNDDGLGAFLGQSADPFEAVERRIDIDRTLTRLPLRDGALGAALSHSTIDHLAASGRGARSSLYRRVKHMRFALTALGLGPP